MPVSARTFPALELMFTTLRDYGIPEIDALRAVLTTASAKVAQSRSAPPVVDTNTLAKTRKAKAKAKKVSTRGAKDMRRLEAIARHGGKTCPECQVKFSRFGLASHRSKMHGVLAQTPDAVRQRSRVEREQALTQQASA
jgi:hypothetical protein